VKISGLGEAGKPWSAEANRPIVCDTIEIFGVERCMFASNFPVDSLCGSFSAIYDGFAAITRDFSEQEKRGLFHDTAIQIYGMKT
jgi:predicted TIM-barrel fold metal-dependent hydrolase